MKCRFEIVLNTPALLVIKDVGHDVMSITNDVEALVEYLLQMSSLWHGRRLEYIDSGGHQDGILFDERGFLAFDLMSDNSALPAVL